MMDTMNLDVQSRTQGVRAKDLLANDVIPAVYYGNGVENQNLQVDYQTFRRLFRAAGTNTIIDLNIDGDKKAKVLVHEIAKHPVTDKITHIDFINVRMDQEIHTNIPIELTGTAPAVKELGGVLMNNLTELEIKCLPKDLIHNIQVSVESLNEFHISIRVKDLQLPPGLTVMNNPEDVVATVIAPRVEEEAPVVAEETPVEGVTPEADGGEQKTE